jgi:hypothetical protein
MNGSVTGVANRSQLRVADEVWIATALLQRENPRKEDFAIEEIVERARSEHLSVPFRPGVYVHVVQHCVANRPPNPARYRMLFETSPGRRRLFRKGDIAHPGRDGKIVPDREAMPPSYSSLLTWYRQWFEAASEQSLKQDPLLTLRGDGKALWANEHADEYVRRIREGWE